ncbi:TPA: helix-turn-helix domain-containing protein [Providencia rettgeri]
MDVFAGQYEVDLDGGVIKKRLTCKIKKKVAVLGRLFSKSKVAIYFSRLVVSKLGAKHKSLRKNSLIHNSMIGKDIKRIREQNNISQSSLALILNMTKESVSKWEREGN